MADDRIARTLLRETVLTELTHAILDGRLPPGHRLRDDDLIAWLGTSRAPIREALAQLADIGLVEMAPNRFTKVAHVSPRTYAESAAVWAALVTRAMHWGILRFPGEQLPLLEALNDELRAAPASEWPPGPSPIDRFVACVVMHCDNTVLIESIQVHAPLLTLGVNSFKDHLDTTPVRGYFDIVIRRCREHDADGFEAEMRAFLDGTMSHFIDRVTGDELRPYRKASGAGS
ncbi:DNA-binding GntR family transcriptional regulator [Frondihabitans sp. PhB188]|uniref:GntR family transcriptional regulator n=1 Tax=Frondihabitans sp. PhB188 TaxID=2485200 RepID=UPI000F47442E|nr:GntR family transcriptional regulator [Frondihabitans sp. PhB188]ROQ39517.1 DNA-binding GntR family transcriptional regulator [Frondihabitans sp. PhB188]